ncbi:hypothetical protein GTW43_33385 [Streptomyces sp. SID5785]|uniref:hypothetical protein n=1 Tax=Streptomyces sp. SID5785 TaxID=2690309 RepID=UPI0013612470|nr:hypothetical protein [Streptomyces sp. SID5785]MZD09939.1 hypothetical protein [Streptomyces sp. SID5785]
MSLPFAEQCVSNPRRQLTAITVIVVLVLTSPSWARLVGAYADAEALLTLLIAAGGTAAKYRNHSNQPRTATPDSA